MLGGESYWRQLQEEASNNKKSSNCSPSWKSYMKKNQKFFTHFVVTSVIILRHSSYIRELNQKGYNYQSSSSSSLALSSPSRGGGNNKLGGIFDLSSSRHGKMGLNLSSSAQYSRVSAAVVVDMVIELLVMIASSPWRKGVGGRVLVDGSDDVASSKD